jgi:ribonucleoside-diphosphate reductase beta chain
MTDTVERTSGEQTPAVRYTSTAGINRDSLPWRLWTKSKKLFWDPADIDYSQDVKDWNEMADEIKQLVAIGARGFMVGEEAVTLDILPLVRAVSAEGRLEETIFLTSFVLEEAKHVDFFRTWFDAIDFDPRTAPQVGYGGNGDNSYQGGGNDIFAGELERVMTRLDTDQSPEAFLDAGLTYNQFIEGVAAIAGYKGWAKFFQMYDVLPGFQKGLQLVQRDERRHIAYGTYLCRRIIAAHPETWDFVERRWAELTEPFLAQRVQTNNERTRAFGGGRGRYVKALVERRLQVLASARTQTVDQVEGGSLDELEATNELPAPV